ncbi:MAG: hypothetical protein JKY37_31830, partial [Nannocystaceae bacterium]|nr:hypothetical protein [Nannocystaceae bacterium]
MGTTSGETQTGSDDAAPAQGKPGGTTSALEQSFDAALKAARTSPESEDAWAHLEDLADTLQRPDEVAEAYRDILDGKLKPAHRDALSRRAVSFHEEWFGDVPEQMHALLSRIIARDNAAEWAFGRLTVVLTVAERWDDLLGLYDTTLETTRDPGRRRRLLDDAAHVAKDFADQPGRAVDYLQALLELDPSNEKLAGVIERLLERQSRWEDLVDVWQGRLSLNSVERAREIRVKIAACFLDKLEAPSSALDELRALVEESPGHRAGCEQLERVVDSDIAATETRLAALALLRTNYDAVDRTADFIAILQRAIAFADPTSRTALRREAARRLAIESRDAEAIAHYAALLAESPTDTDARKQMRQLARRSDLAAQHAEALEAAADAANDDGPRIALLLEAAELATESLGDPPRAIALYERALSLSDADPSLALAAAHRLNELLSQANDGAERRLAVLESLAELERASVVRRAVLGEAAALAAEVGDTDRALANWQRRLDADANDHEALDAMVTVLERAERWTELIPALQRRAEGSQLPQQRRVDLIRIAKVLEDQLADPNAAVDAWLSLREEYGDEPETIASLDRMMTALDRHEALAVILREASNERRAQAAELLSRVGDVLRIELSQHQDAAHAYGEALGVMPTDERARVGLGALIEVPAVAAFSGRTLASAYEATEDWDGILDLVDPRVETAEDPRDAVRLLREAAGLAEAKRAGLSRAQAFMGRAVVLDPADTGLEHELIRLAASTGDWAAVAASYRTAIAESGPSPARAAHLYRAEGQILEDRLDDPAGATRAFGAAVEIEPESLETQRALIRVAARAAAWGPAARGAVALSTVRATLDDPSLDAIAAAADAAGGWTELVRGLAEALALHEFSRELGRALHSRCAHWAAEQASDAELAEEQALLAVEFDPRHGEMLRFVADLQRDRNAAELPATLLRIDALTDDDLDAMWEAAEVLKGRSASAEDTRDALDTL